MVIQETLRLYLPAGVALPSGQRALTDVKIGGLDAPWKDYPRGEINVAPGVQDKDADEFHPDRFADGVAAACRPAHMYTPFGHGPRTCIGQNLAMVELKVVFALVPSPRYRHAPMFRLTIEPGFGMPLLVTRLL
jgi:cytochrome P450